MAITTLLLQGGTLPALIRVLGIRGVDATADLRESATLFDDLADTGLRVLETPDSILGAGTIVEPDVIERVRQDTFLRSESSWERAHVLEEKDAPSPHRQYRQLRLAVVQAEREALLTARREGRYPSRILAEAQRILDIEETRLRPRTAGH
ncbi:hypothetical protein [Arthrobacter agilis]|uniref:hypothetical protein n=1 Tax=Arthrobacter agilis TaxID=37921 RepID=UPI0027D8C73F|nr:hypothetical protein [Arthrobacter agilis]